MLPLAVVFLRIDVATSVGEGVGMTEFCIDLIFLQDDDFPTETSLFFNVSTLSSKTISGKLV